MSPSALDIDALEIKDTKTALKYLEQGRKAEESGDRVKAIEAYEAAFTADPDHEEVCFRLAYNLDLVGEDDEALHLYEQCAGHKPPRLHALLNLSVKYEDRGMYAQAERCLRQVLATDPNHPRARLYLKDVVASKGMVVQEEATALDEVNDKVLDTPVTDFELSVRTRNALRKMSVRTLGDLLRITEAELRSYKNFGEASIEEIKAMLSQQGLRLGQAADARQRETQREVYDQIKNTTGSSDEVLSRPVTELQLSVRARKALALLNVQSIGDLCLRSEPELMGVKNFGMTSLLEIKEKLTELGLTLRQVEGA